jgi:hypothetical protein
MVKGKSYIVVMGQGRGTDRHKPDRRFILLGKFAAALLLCQLLFISAFAQGKKHKAHTTAKHRTKAAHHSSKKRHTGRKHTTAKSHHADKDDVIPFNINEPASRAAAKHQPTKGYNTGSSGSRAAEQAISGHVMDALSGEELRVYVQVAGTNIGGYTGYQGKFSIPIPDSLAQKELVLQVVYTGNNGAQGPRPYNNGEATLLGNTMIPNKTVAAGRLPAYIAFYRTPYDATAVTVAAPRPKIIEPQKPIILSNPRVQIMPAATDTVKKKTKWHFFKRKHE